ncbi:hypothetical protein ABH930_006848 [Kitasatospora sp. GAS204A]|nr:hypothetical protein [Kitasatospora sp. GAS204B]
MAHQIFRSEGSAPAGTTSDGAEALGAAGGVGTAGGGPAWRLRRPSGVDTAGFARGQGES